MSVTMVQRMESPRFFLSSAIFFISMLISKSRGTCGAPHGTRCVRHARGTCVHGVRTVLGALGASCPAPPGTYSTQEAGTRSPYVRHGGPARPWPRGVRVSFLRHRRSHAPYQGVVLEERGATLPRLPAGRQGDEKHVGLAVGRQRGVLLQVPLRLVRGHARRALEAGTASHRVSMRRIAGWGAEGAGAAGQGRDAPGEPGSEEQGAAGRRSAERAAEGGRGVPDNRWTRHLREAERVVKGTETEDGESAISFCSTGKASVPWVRTSSVASSSCRKTARTSGLAAALVTSGCVTVPLTSPATVFCSSAPLSSCR